MEIEETVEMEDNCRCPRRSARETTETKSSKGQRAGCGESLRCGNKNVS